MGAWITSFFVIAFEVRGSLYFLDTFMERKETGKLRKFRFLIYYAAIFAMALTDYWIDMLKLIPVILTYIVLNMFFYKTSMKQSIFFSVLNYGIIFLIDYAVAEGGRIFLASRTGQFSASNYIFILIAKVFWLIIIVVISKMYKQRKYYIGLTNKEWLQLSIIPGFTICSLLCIILNNSTEKNMQSVYVFFAVGLVAMNFIIINLMQNILKKEEQIRAYMLINHNQKNQIDAYRDMKEVYDRQRKKMHDYKNQLGTIQTLIKGKDIKSALIFTEKLTESISVDMSAINTNHPVVNAVLNQKYYSAQEKKISMILKVGDLHEIRLKEEEIVILLANLIDNAIRECEKVLEKKDKAVIRLKLVCENGKLILSIRNPVIDKVRIIDDTVQKKGSDSQGIGLLNVKTVVNKYEGDMALSCDEKEFKVVVMI